MLRCSRTVEQTDSSRRSVAFPGAAFDNKMATDRNATEGVPYTPGL